MADSKPYSPACDRNRDPILNVLKAHLADRRQVLEIGSGTGQHAVHFAAAMPHLSWQTADVAANLGGIRAWLNDARLPNTPDPLVFDCDLEPERVPLRHYDAVFSANTLHIMSWRQVQTLFARLPSLVVADALLIVYGPFNRNGAFTSDSNRAFDASLRRADPLRGIRDFEAVDALARAAGFALVADQPMPANNSCIVWRTSAVSGA